MKQKIDPVVASWIQPPERVLDAEGGIDQREILRRRIERKPNSAQAIRRRQQLVIDDIGVIVPDESAIPCRPIRKDRHSCQNQTKNAGATARRKERLSYFVHSRFYG